MITRRLALTLALLLATLAPAVASDGVIEINLLLFAILLAAFGAVRGRRSHPRRR